MDTKQITQIAVDALENVKGENIVVLDTQRLSPLFSTMIICTGNSTRQVSALIERVEEDFKKHNIDVIGVEGKNGSDWVLLDGGDIIVHVMLPHTREYYALDTLWNETLRTKAVS